MRVWVVTSEYGIDGIYDSREKARQRKIELDHKLLGIKKHELEQAGHVTIDMTQVIQ